MSSQSAQPQVSNNVLTGSSASSIKLVQQQVQGFIQGLNNEELTKLLEIFEKSISSPSSISKSCKMVQYKCYESKIDLNGKVGCGFGRSEEEAIAISIKDFFEIILQEEKYLYQVKECFRQMKGQTTQGSAQQTQNSQPVIQNLNQINTTEKTQSQNKIVCKKVESETENSPTERKMPNQVIQDIDESESNPSDNNQDYQMADNQISLIEMQINESNVYELSKKIGNISVINGPNVIASTNFNNNSQQDIDEMLLKIMFEEEKKFQQQNSQHNQLHSHQPSNNINQINFNQYLNSLQNSQSNQPLTQFQIYQMQYLQQQQQQQQFQQQNKNQGSQLQLQQIQQYFQSQQNSQGSYFQSALNNQQVVNSNTNIVNSNHMKNNDINSIEQQQQQQKQIEELSPQSYENVSTPPNKNKRSSLSINNRAQQAQVNQQLNDTAFMPTKNVNTSNNTSNLQNNQQKLLRNNSIQNNNNHSSSQQEHQGSHFASQQNGSNFVQNNIQSGNNQYANTQNSISLYANKENSFQNQNGLNLVNSNNLTSTQSNFGLANKPTNQIASQSNTFNQTVQINHQNSKTNLHLHSTHSQCCNHKEELERERNKVENLEKKIKLLMEENKILKSLLLDNQSATTSQTIKNKLNSNQTPRGQLLTQNNTTNTNLNNNIQEQTELKNVNNNNNSQNFSNTKIASRMSQANMRSQSQDPTSKYLNNNNNQIITHTQYSSGQKKTNFNTSDSKNSYLYGSSGKYANDDLNTSHLSLNNSSQLNHSSMKKNVPKLNLEVLPNYHGNFHKSQNNKLLQEYNQKYMYKKRF
ncbi:hypothetical protein ABPG74_016969 [Tetrahymena malaccensis]